jgi:hypothetical protein
METAYAAVHLWKAAVEKAGTTDTKTVREAVVGQAGVLREHRTVVLPDFQLLPPRHGPCAYQPSR